MVKKQEQVFSGLVCEDCDSYYPYHEEFCMSGDSGWIPIIPLLIPNSKYEWHNLEMEFDKVGYSSYVRNVNESFNVRGLPLEKHNPDLLHILFQFNRRIEELEEEIRTLKMRER